MILFETPLKHKKKNRKEKNIIFNENLIKIIYNLNFGVFKSAMTLLAFPCRKSFLKFTRSRADNNQMLSITVFGPSVPSGTPYYC